MILKCQAIIFDLDGILVDSEYVIEKHWRRWALRNRMDPDYVVQKAQGRRTIDTISTLAPSLDADAEAERLTKDEGPDTDGLRVYPEAVSLVNRLPEGCWAVATSGTRLTAMTRLGFANLPIPGVLVTADDVKNGKPEPEAYILAASRLKTPPSQCIVIEDAPAGVEAGNRAGMRTIGVATTHPVELLDKATVVVPEIASLSIEISGNDLTIRI